jgi:hypothetical protein
MAPAGAAGIAGRQFNTPCENPEPIIGVNGNDTGYVTCTGFVHRPERRSCDSIAPRPDPVPPSLAISSYCTMDAECGDDPLAYCGVDLFQIFPYVRCQKGCLSDDDCAEGQVCYCTSPMGVCIATEDCKSDSDCSGGLCTMISRRPVCRESTLGVFACQRLDDACQTSECGANCRPTATGGRECVWEGQCGARPFLVRGEAHVAILAESNGGWGAAATPSLTGLTDEQRVALEHHWTRNALAEHASIAAFARFSLALLSLGAPASLVAETARALGDEIRHAELCFGLASAYAGRQIGPGKLPCDGAIADASFFEVVKTASAEGCVSETLAAAEVAEAAARAADPAVRRALDRIAEDEARHAELAWKFLRWALDRASPDVRKRLVAHAARLVDAELETLTPLPHNHTDSKLVEHGLLSPAACHAVRRAALSEVLIPLVTALRSNVEHSPPRPWAQA